MKEQNENLTFRISSKVLERLRLEAENNGTRLNTYVNQIISGYLQWDIHSVARKFGVIEKGVLKELVRQINNEELERIAELVDVADIMPLIAGREDEESLIRAILITARRSGFIVRTFENNGKRRIIIQHDLGAKWSEFYKMQVQQILRYAATHSVVLETADNSLIIYADTASL